MSKLSEDMSYDLTGVFTPALLKSEGLSVNGNEPSDGWIQIEKGQVIDYSLKFDEYVVNYNEETNEPVVIKNGELEDSAVIYYGSSAVEVYFDPITGEKCTVDDYHLDNSLAGFNGVVTGDNLTKTTDNQTSCLKWYAYSEQGEGLNMILDHNTTVGVAWLSADDYNASMDAETIKNTYGVTYKDNIVPTAAYNFVTGTRGPLTLLNQLMNDTSGWSDTLIRNDSYGVNIDVNKDDGTSSTFEGEGEGFEHIEYVIDYSLYKARLISAEEIASITGANISVAAGGYGWTNSNTDGKYYAYAFGRSSSGSECGSNLSMEEGTNSYYWLYDNLFRCTNYGCKISSENSMVQSYWTSTPNAYYLSRIYVIDDEGSVSCTTAPRNIINFPMSTGIRPVITVPKNIVFE